MTAFFAKLHNDDLGKLILRLTVGVLMLLHGYAKLRHGIDVIAGMMPAPLKFLAYAVYLGEVVAPVLIIVGYFTRPAALVLAINMVVAVLIAHRRQLLDLNPDTGGWLLELQGFYFFGSLAILFLGAGKFSLSGGKGAWD